MVWPVHRPQQMGQTVRERRAGGHFDGLRGAESHGGHFQLSVVNRSFQFHIFRSSSKWILLKR